MASAEIQLDGVLVNADGPLFALVDTDKMKFSEWLRLGDSFEEYRIVSFDEPSESLVVKKNATDFRLTLRSAKVRAAKPGYSREWALKIASRRFRDSKFIIRVEARIRGNQWYYKCVEVWKAEGVGPAVGEIFLGPTLETSASPQAPLPYAEASALFDRSSPEELLYLNEFPSVAGKPSGGLPMTNGRLNLCPEVPLDELRALLPAVKTISQ